MLAGKKRFDCSVTRHCDHFSHARVHLARIFVTCTVDFRISVASASIVAVGHLTAVRQTNSSSFQKLTVANPQSLSHVRQSDLLTSYSSAIPSGTKEPRSDPPCGRGRSRKEHGPREAPQLRLAGYVRARRRFCAVPPWYCSIADQFLRPYSMGSAHLPTCLAICARNVQVQQLTTRVSSQGGWG